MNAKHTEHLDTGKQFAVLVFRDEKIQAMKIAESDISQRYEDYEFVSTLIEWVETALPGDSIMVRNERVMRVR